MYQPEDGKVKGHGLNKLELPLDEDDYLQPQSSKPATYMDLIDGGPGKLINASTNYVKMSSLLRIGPPLPLYFDCKYTMLPVMKIGFPLPLELLKK